MLLTNSWLWDIPVLVITITYLVYKYFSTRHKYWRKRGVYSPRTQPIIGHFLDMILLKTNMGMFLKKYYDEIDKPFFGLYVFDDAFFVARDPKLIKEILVKNFGYFVDRNIASPDHSTVYQNMMFFQKSPAWKNDRAKVSVIFTPSRLKGMLPILEQCAEDLVNYIKSNQTIMETRELAAKYSTDIISQCAFGINSHCYDQKPSTFRIYGGKCFDFSWRNAISQMIYFFKPHWVSILKLEFMPAESMSYFANVFLEAMKSRKIPDKINDLIDILNDLKKHKQLSKDDTDLVCGIAIQFFLAGFETTSSVIAFTLYELAKQPNIQDTLRTEIKEVLSKYGSLTNEALQEMPYLDMCLKESLRIYPILPFLERKCNTDYPIPNSTVTNEKGTPILIPLYALQMDEQHFPDPHRYNPDRFKKKIDTLFYIPFGEGPRGCIGERFGKLSVKMALVKILLNNTVTVCKETPDPVKFEPKTTLLQSTVGLPLMFNSLKL